MNKKEFAEGILNKTEFIEWALQLPANTLAYSVSQHLTRLCPEKALIETDNAFFNIDEYALAGLCHIEPKSEVFNQFDTIWEGEDAETLTAERVYSRSIQSWQEITWQGNSLEVLQLTWQGNSCNENRSWLLADTTELAKDFLSAVCSWNAELRGEVLVFDNGYWRKDQLLFQAIQKATFANLVLKGEMKEKLYEDLSSFFLAREIYKTHNLDWKRGILLVGPPGNGKTHAVKALINLLQKPCLYVKSFKTSYNIEEESIHEIFTKARKLAPCVLILEDLDSLINTENRAFFLNELDGFAANEGILTLATTNHPERLDPAIVNRPSRFDRKYHFNLPTYAERLEYIQLWNEAHLEATRVSADAIQAIALASEDFSFAYLKELFLSSMVRWLATPEAGSLDKHLSEQIGYLQEQMTAEKPASVTKSKKK